MISQTLCALSQNLIRTGASHSQSPFGFGIGIAIGLFLTSANPGFCAEKPGAFEFELGGDNLILTYNSLPVATYVFHDSKILRPYFTSAHTPEGIQVTRNHPPIDGEDATDHATMHPGIWMAFGDISGEDFWRNKASVKHVRFVESPSVADGVASFAVENRFVSAAGKPVCSQHSKFQWRVNSDGFLLIWDSTFLADAGDFYFGDQEEMGLGARVATPITARNGGTLLNSAGGKNEEQTWGKTAKWTDYSGAVQGKLAGITIMPDPKNFRESWFHNRDYGAFVANPFGRNALTRGEKSRVGVRSGEQFRIRFGVWIHSSRPSQPADLETAYSTFLSLLGP